MVQVLTRKLDAAKTKLHDAVRSEWVQHPLEQAQCMFIVVFGAATSQKQQHQQEMDQKVNQQQGEFKAAIERQNTFIRSILQEKESLTLQIEQLTQKLAGTAATLVLHSKCILNLSVSRICEFRAAPVPQC